MTQLYSNSFLQKYLHFSESQAFRTTFRAVGGYWKAVTCFRKGDTGGIFIIRDFIEASRILFRIFFTKIHLKMEKTIRAHLKNLFDYRTSTNYLSRETIHLSFPRTPRNKNDPLRAERSYLSHAEKKDKERVQADSVLLTCVC